VQGFVPPHPGDVQRALVATLQSAPATTTPVESILSSLALPDVPRPRQSDKILEPTSANIPEFSQQEHDCVIAIVSQSKNPLSQHVLNKVREQITGVAVKEIRNYVRMLIQRGEIAAPET
jgi:hypothetical protein